MPEIPDLADLPAPVVAFLTAVVNQNAAAARAAYDAHPEISTASLHVAAVLGRADDVRHHIAQDPGRVQFRIGPMAVDPLLCLCYSPFHGESEVSDEGLLTCARLLLDAGADPATCDAQYGVPALCAVTGQHNVPAIAELLIDRGANPNDGESLFHAAEHFHEESLELLLSRGADPNVTGDWGNTPVHFLLNHWDVADHPNVARGIRWLLDHGADPDVPSGRDQETALHAAARRGQPPEIVHLLLEKGANPNSRRGSDGLTPWTLARRTAHDALATLLEEAGATPEPLTPADTLLAACARGRAEAARALATPDVLATLTPADARLLPEAAGSARLEVVRACLAAGFPVDVTDQNGATALHHAAIQGRPAEVRELLAAGADFGIRDREHDATPMGWASFGADHVQRDGGDYEGVVQALLEAGDAPPETAR